MKKLLIIVITAALLTGCAVTSVTPDTVDFFFYDGEDTLNESVESWKQFEEDHK